MTAAVTRVFGCDHVWCDAEFRHVGVVLQEAFPALKAAGWTVTQRAQHFCPDHKPERAS